MRADVPKSKGILPISADLLPSVVRKVVTFLSEANQRPNTFPDLAQVVFANTTSTHTYNTLANELDYYWTVFN